MQLTEKIRETRGAKVIRQFDCSTVRLFRLHGSRLILSTFYLNQSFIAPFTGLHTAMNPASTKFLFLVLLGLSSISASENSPLLSFPLIPHHVEQTRRGLKQEQEQFKSSNDGSLRRRANEAEHVGALYQGYGTHYVDLWCGSPPQRQTVIVDTGSSVTSFPCSECEKCGVPDHHIDDLFEEGDSSTYKKSSCASNDQCSTRGTSCKDESCKITMSYSEGSRWDATMGHDRCYIAGPHEQPLLQEYSTDDPLDPLHATHYAFDLEFGCQTSLNGLFITQMADGIMGMNPVATSYWSQLSKNLGTAKQFSLCFTRNSKEDEKGTLAGALTLGGSDTRLHTTDMVYSSGALMGRERRWNVKVRKIYLRDGTAGESVSPIVDNSTTIELPFEEKTFNAGSVIVDSGATDTYLNKAIASVFQDTFTELAGRKYSNTAWSLTQEELKSLPTLIIQLQSSGTENSGKDPFATPGLAGNLDSKNPNDVLLAVPPSHYMEYEEKSGKYTARIYMKAEGHSTLGANVIMGHDVLFDADNDRLGWSESACNYSKLIDDNGFDFPITGELKRATDVIVANNGGMAGSYFEPDEAGIHRRENESDKQNDSHHDEKESEKANVSVECHEELIDREQNFTSKDRFKNETLVAMCKVRKGADEFFDYCDSPECRIPVVVGLVLALLAGMCFCNVMKCVCYHLFCCCCCKKKDPYIGLDTEGIELVDGDGYRDELGDSEDEEENRNGTKKKQYRDMVRSKKKKNESFKGDFKDFI
jgi:hypothetical protein